MNALTKAQRAALDVLINYYGYGRGLTGMRLDNLLYWKYVNMKQLRSLEMRGYIAIDAARNWVAIGETFPPQTATVATPEQTLLDAYHDGTFKALLDAAQKEGTDDDSTHDID